VLADCSGLAEVTDERAWLVLGNFERELTENLESEACLSKVDVEGVELSE
jgi:hypothetical protein